MAILKIDGQSISYVTAGDDGPPVLLLHGTTMSHTAFDGVRAAMPPDTPYRFVMMDLPGSGESTLPDAPLTLDSITRHAFALMDHLGHERYHIVGFSIGAPIAVAMAAYQPRVARSLTLIAGWVAADARMKATFELWRRLITVDPALFTRYVMVDGFTSAFHELAAPILEAVIEASALTIAPGSAAQIDLDISLDIADLVGQIAVPTLIIGGAEDRWVDISHSHDLGGAITGARVEVLAAGHMMMAEQPAQVAALLHPHLAAR